MNEDIREIQKNLGDYVSGDIEVVPKVKKKTEGEKRVEKNLKSLKESLLNEALSGNNKNPQFARLWAELEGHLDKKKDNGKQEFSAIEVAELSGRFVGYLRERLGSCGGICPVCGDKKESEVCQESETLLQEVK